MLCWPWGRSWSLHFCQSVTATVVSRCFGGDSLIRDRAHFRRITFPLPLDPQLSSDNSGAVDDNTFSRRSDVAGAAYVDNFAVFSTRAAVADINLNHIIHRLNAMVLETHEQVGASLDGELVRLSFNRCRVPIKFKRIWRLRQALKGLLDKGEVFCLRTGGRARSCGVGHAVAARVPCGSGPVLSFRS